ncbi:`extra sex combs` (WD-40 repeat family) [Pyrenophora seminiperda CCB06]|uniref:`extra sex combs` (WD-40 repeat family) n=1 Tax=Pyrenophora seminiperda CCB06 TaxID=1302712 RepID=A0A3M7MG98_9PLEO|nr:`extra sex combs` (WD-40 repeat family) [Pyrenophora seminiperda CCB06]
MHLYDVEFYPYTPPGRDPVFAVCGGPFVQTIICRCVLAKDYTIQILRWFEDEEASAEHGEPANRLNYYNSVVWSQAENGDPLVCVTGDSRIKVLNVKTGELVFSINDLAVSPVDPTILASVSIDCSLRIWSLHPDHQNQPLAAICYGQGHKEQVLTLWSVPDNLKEHAGTDRPVKIHYPHFSTTEIHTDFIDWEDKIILWSIDEFSSDQLTTPPAPIPTSSAVYSRTPVTIPANTTSKTLSAWGGRFQRLLQFELPHTNQFYIRFSVFHELGRPPVLAAANEKSKVFFWDLQRLENSGTGENDSQNAKGLPLGLPRHVREESTASTTSSTYSTSSGATRAKRRKVKEQHIDRGISDPFRSIKAHKVIEIPKFKAFAFRHCAWSRDGQWFVSVGDCGTMAVFNRWENGVPPVSLDKDLPTEEVNHTSLNNPDTECTIKSDSQVVSGPRQVCAGVATD